mgnify:CR=1 FL=1|tara:strand:- start:324 stop:716 length:393 start_codon:yes stop_codon:yes gene_type:complete
MNNTHTQLSDELNEAFDAFEKKYFDLVWYARKAPADNEEYWGGTPDEIKNGALNAACQVEEQYPSEIDDLKSPELGSWTHGFNSGCLAAMRYVITAVNKHKIESGEVPEEADFWFGGLKDAEAEFPFLDT